MRTSAHPLLEGGVAKAIIGGALVGVFQDFVGLVDLLEALLARSVTGIAIGMPFHRELAECGLNVGVVGATLNLEDLVVASLGHPRFPTHRISRGAGAELYLIVHAASKNVTSKGRKVRSNANQASNRTKD